MESQPVTKPRFSLLKSLSQVDWRTWLPSRGNAIFTFVVILTLFWAQSANALPWQQPASATTSTGTWPYQGRLADSAGTPITNTVPMVFRLYSAATDGVPLWEENWTGPNSVQVSDGLFNVMLGSLNSIPQSLVSSNGSLWLGITAGTDNEMTPRIQLGSVPFAVQALTVPDGSISTVKLENLAITTEKLANESVTRVKLGADISFVPPDGSVSPEKINLPNGNVCLQSQQAVSLSGGYATLPVPTLSTTFTLEKTSQVLVWSVGLANFQTTGTLNKEASFHLIVDNISTVQSFSTTNNEWFNLNGQRLITLPAGEHTIKGAVSSQQPGLMTLQDENSYQTCLYYLVLQSP
ncbi:MAG: hypothetical protein CVU44_02480 [Chloroflexi bacterium HGW-Chloroflexi-6]|nr:MAG: hypothetical protein CVU44_02480 [Chloroflexi bacterium HGW-Chloroflexi-6]